ncbi:hypothetical protein ACH42_13830 [Endozoicomonas sp. (ex Bugula neritina AB1)]|nr:hypothetical protein ACH42_13830 [Endozoicomonas sp. (ex Bugula neritina AB1)]
MSGFRLKLSLLVFSLLPILVGLAIWQLSRYQDKKELEQVYENRRQLPPVTLSKLAEYQDPLYLPVEVTGKFDPTRYFLLDNQVWQGRAGYELIMPFKTDDDRWLLVDRGWIPMIHRDTWPKVNTEKSTQTIKGLVYRTFGKPFLLSEDIWGEGWPKRIQAIDFQRMKNALNLSMGDFTLVLDPGQPTVNQVRPLILNMKSDRHLGYAFQWFAMALVLMSLYVYRMRSGGRSSHDRNNHNRSAL